ncbi:MAG: aryl-sulfate sulfotransferase [Chthoniobacterales bacterium]
MLKLFCLLFFAIAFILTPVARGTQADETTITIDTEVEGATPFIHQLTLTASDPDVLKSIRFTVQPKAGSVTRSLSGNYARDYLVTRGFLQGDQIFLPVYGLYADFTNTVTLAYSFLDGSAKEDTTTITTVAFEDPCGYDKPTVLQARTTNTALSYDYILIRGSCSDFSPAVIDTDGALRWVGPGGFTSAHVNFFDNAFYITDSTALYRVELDGTVTFLHDYADIGVVFVHHNIDRGKAGLILDVNTEDHKESLNLEEDAAGNVVKMWDMVDVISEAMLAGGDDPADFVVPSSKDWFHNNATAYNRADDSIVISSRENFVICIDYETLAIKWILGDPTKKWHEFPSLAQYALELAPGSLPPIGQHAVSIAYDQNLLLFDNGKDSDIQIPVGEMRDYSSPRKYHIDLASKTATEVWNYEMDQSVVSGICSGVYEDQPLNYLIDYADVNGSGAPVQYVQFIGLEASGEKTFYYQYDNLFCITAFNVLPLHLENTSFPTVGPQPLNISTRGLVKTGDGALIGGFIVTGDDPKEVLMRALGPSLADSGVSGALADPKFGVFDSAGTLIAGNDDWQDDPAASEITASGLAPLDSAEAATLLTLSPAAYTVVVTGEGDMSGIGLVEAYDLSPNSGSRLANISTRGFVGESDSVLISGFIIGEVAQSTVILRALGPSLASAGVTEPLSDPLLTIYDGNGAFIAVNDNWQEDPEAEEISDNCLAPTEAAESATVLFLPAGAYTAIVRGADAGTGVGLVEFYELSE